MSIKTLLLISLFFASSCWVQYNNTSHEYRLFVGEDSLISAATDAINLAPKNTLRKLKLISKGAPQDTFTSYIGNDNPTTWMYQATNGHIVTVAEVRDEKLNGQYFTYYKHNQIKTIGHYKNDKKHGIWTQFHQNGMQVNYGTYIFDNQIDKWFYYDTLKLFREERNYADNNNYIISGFDSLDRLSYRGEVLNQKKHNKWIEFDTLGNRSIEMNYLHDVIDDSLLLYENGKVVAFQYYDNGVLLNEGVIETNETEK